MASEMTMGAPLRQGNYDLLEPKTPRLHCLRCQREYPRQFLAFCKECQGAIDVAYDLDRARFHDSEDPLVRYFDLLPIANPENLVPADLRRTPLVHAKSLGKRLGMPWLLLKDETTLPTRTTKDRMAAVAWSYLVECGVRRFCTSSTGNSSSAFARLAPRIEGSQVYVFTAEDFIQRVHGADSPRVTHVGLRGATFVDAFQAAGHFAAKYDIASERGFFNLGRREGLKLTFFEAAEQSPRPIDWYVQAVSSAMGVMGTYKGARELLAMKTIDRLPKLLCVQQESCPPMARAFREGSETILPEHIVPHPRGIASAILRGDPTRAYPYVREIVLDSRGTMTTVSEAEIRAARQMVNEYEGIDPCFSASTSLAGLVKLVREGKFPTNETVLVNLTGGDRPPSAVDEVRWLKRDQDEWIPDEEGISLDAIFAEK